MDGNRDESTSASRAEASRGMRLAIALILLFVALILVIRAWAQWQHGHQIKHADDDYAAFVAAVGQAENFADPLQRCLHYPDPPGSHWHRDTTLAYCRLHTRRTLALADIAALLAQGKASDVDKTFQAYLDAQRRDPTQAGVFDMAFHKAGLDNADPGTRKIVDEWKRQSPGSAFALIASGIQYLDAAQKARGYGWAKDLTETQTDGMYAQLLLARQDLDRATSLLPSATQAYRSLIYAAALGGDHNEMYRAAKAGLKVDPANFGIRNQMMNQAQPKWGYMFGGEYEQKREDDALAARNPLLRIVSSMPAVHAATCDCGGTSQQYLERIPAAMADNIGYQSADDLARQAYDDNPRLAVELFSESLRFLPQQPDLLRWRAQLMVRLGDPKGALESVMQIARRFPQDNGIALTLASIYSQTGHTQESADTYEAILRRDPDNQDAMAWLGDLYNHAGHQPERAKQLSDTLISRHPENPQGYIVRACYLMDHNLPGRYETIHYFIDRFGDRDEFTSQVAEMRAYLASHPEPIKEE